MTKKDYELIASILKEGEPNTDIMMKDVCYGFADMFERKNPKFNRSKFLQACGLEA